MDLATQPAVVFNKERFVKHVLFIIRFLRDVVTAFHIHVTTGTHGHATARSFYGKFSAFAQLHHVHPHVRGGLQFVELAIPIDDIDFNDVIHSVRLKTVNAVDRGVFQDQVLIRINPFKGTLHHQRRLMETAQDELQLARIGVDIPDGIYAGDIRAVIERVNLYSILGDIEIPI